MLKKMRKKAQNKKGFTLVELIVVIVIILILAAVLVPSLLKYVEKANKANCKADAATILSQLQADYAAGMAKDATGEDAVDAAYTVNGVTVTPDAAAPQKGKATYTIENEEITVFQYNNGTYTATWRAKKGANTTVAGWKVEKNTGGN
ncbi:MAG: prepilin-type N-terminal cleavage/methylation domain-containing protein [Faecalicatena sp.]|uniref:prepilin-type N-terminal cleavage/methylation domain-containing protein n=1 Tax=Faecalicatena sp. TaxID=2005360 RepID=UPI00258FA65D|nr:prepilin-type N-terminal cleavage/methylation domain-containing protein [Faecalicatena sp.]MCI6464038.1 prepilin-type N-terminal cleavage/methylation domain-containing protein [Faecalicatena sp.]MDY5619236.1 prepilin-type N-terminal cleavage/methylation domain-containing protein [Lachnospiraceae bacterium]